MLKKISLDAAISEIALTLCPRGEIVDAKRRVRDVVAYARKTILRGVIGKSSSGELLLLEPIEFQRWAAKKWPVMQATYKLPGTGGGRIAMQPLTAQGLGISIPASHDELARQFVENTSKLLRTEAELNECKLQLEQLEAEAAKRRISDVETTRRKSEAGKQGGRGRWGGRPK
jgi:hypothetical protein